MAKEKRAKPSLYKWVHAPEGTKLFGVGIFLDGTLRNPYGYPEDVVRAAVLAADERRHKRRSEAAKEAAETRRRRTQARVYQVAKRITSGGSFGPKQRCVICGKALDDPQSVERGIGSECWQDVLGQITRQRASERVPMRG